MTDEQRQVHEKYEKIAQALFAVNVMLLIIAAYGLIH